MIMVTFTSDAFPVIFPLLLNCPCCYVLYYFLSIAAITPQKLGGPIRHLSHSAPHIDCQSTKHEKSCSRQSKTITAIFIRDLSK